MRRKRIEYYDSFHGNARDFFRNVRSWLQGESKAHYSRDFDFSGESSTGRSIQPLFETRAVGWRTCIVRCETRTIVTASSMPFFSSDWTEFRDTSCPGQANCSDCGVFTTQFAERLSRDVPFDFAQKDMPLVRRRLCYELIAGQLLPLE